MRRIRGSDIAMVFQDPMSSLNPVLTIGDQISETLRLHQGLTGAAARKRVRSSCSTWCGFPMPHGASTIIRIASPAACGSG